MSGGRESPPMAQETSERACDRCRERRVKCDKRQPRCLRCEKLGKTCPGYDKKRKFVDEGVTLRKKYQFSTDQPQIGQPSASKIPEAIAGQDSPAPLASLPTNRQPMALQSGNSPPSQQLISINQPTIDADRLEAPQIDFAPGPPLPSFSIDPTTEAMLLANPPMQLPLNDTDPLSDELWKDDIFDPSYFDLQPEIYYSEAGNTCGFIPNIPEIIDEVDHSSLVLDHSASATPLSTGLGSTGLFSADDISNLWAPESQLKTSAQITHEREHEMAYLIRHFTDTLGPWMDLFDREKHFTHLVPLKALRDALLRNAIAAVAAKQLGRVKGRRPFSNQQFQRPSAMEVLDESVEIDWFYKAANYYDKAIAFSRQYLQAVSGGAGETEASDDLLVAISIFSLYESLDSLETCWLQHLIGLKSLLTAVSPAKQVRDHVAPTLTVGRLASFWNFARADYQAAFLNHQKTLLDTEDIPLWNSYGLEIQRDGSLYKLTDVVRSDSTHCRSLTELVAHTLLWLVLRAMNYLASEEDSRAKQAQWEQIVRQLDHWYGNLPSTYQPCAQIRHPFAPMADCSKGSHFTEFFFSIDICAAALQLYHFTRILLLLHRPVSNSSSMFGNRLKQYREVSSEAIKHAHEIVGIALGRPQPAIRVEMLLPLSIAGACLEENEERKVVLELLRAIEKDTGCSTETKCQELVQEWGWTTEPQPVA